MLIAKQMLTHTRSKLLLVSYKMKLTQYSKDQPDSGSYQSVTPPGHPKYSPG